MQDTRYIPDVLYLCKQREIMCTLAIYLDSQEIFDASEYDVERYLTTILYFANFD